MQPGTQFYKSRNIIHQQLDALQKEVEKAVEECNRSVLSLESLEIICTPKQMDSLTRCSNATVQPVDPADNYEDTFETTRALESHKASCTFNQINNGSRYCLNGFSATHEN